MKKKFGKVKTTILLFGLIIFAAVAAYILINRAQYADKLYRNSDYYKTQNGKYE